ncbi:hypothetical protein BBF96_10065 [Anoxybacter fermentans]|uniref:Uncharacterized protein n=1 Tax=Anoxybacter fermentans TaxID=1323375 RepID=A0A3S9SZI3_9FIRM|nr:hypothetical protein [Anoxybacter fermentans]AZR73697.1 hypothetical protein BBF96_10065 [Anoxybacter fermentans]
MRVNLKKKVLNDGGIKVVGCYFLLLLMGILVMGSLLYFFGPEIEKISLPYFIQIKKYFPIFLLTILIFGKLIKKTKR